jgi:hypothetical protein
MLIRLWVLTVLGAVDDGCPVEVGSSSVAVLSNDPEPSVLVSPVVPVSAQMSSVAPVSA